MKNLPLLGLVSALAQSCFTLNANAEGITAQSHRSQAVYEVEQKAARQFSSQTAALKKQFTLYCASAHKDDTALKQTWHQTMLAWMALQGQQRGPVVALEQSWNVQFWPDKKNTTGRKMAALTKHDEAFSADDIASQSVTVQGLGALEWLLFDEASTLSSKSSTCGTGAAIAKNLHNNATIIEDAWGKNPWTSLERNVWASEYISLLSNQLEFSMKKLSRPLANIGKPRPYFAESWRSQTSLSNLKANIASLRSLYLADGDGLDAMLRAKGNPALADKLLRQLDNTLETWPEDKSLFAALKTRQGYQLTLAQYNKLERLRDLIQQQAAVELGVVIGFNATDGD